MATTTREGGQTAVSSPTFERLNKFLEGHKYGEHQDNPILHDLYSIAKTFAKIYTPEGEDTRELIRKANEQNVTFAILVHTFADKKIKRYGFYSDEAKQASEALEISNSFFRELSGKLREEGLDFVIQQKNMRVIIKDRSYFRAIRTAYEAYEAGELHLETLKEKLSKLGNEFGTDESARRILDMQNYLIHTGNTDGVNQESPPAPVVLVELSQPEAGHPASHAKRRGLLSVLRDRKSKPKE